MTDITISRAWAERELQKLEAEIRQLEGKREMLLQLLGGSEQHVLGLSGASPADNRYRGMSPADAVEAIVADEPGIVQKQLVNRLEDVVASQAENKRAVLNSAVKRKLDDGILVKRIGGRLYHPEDAPGGDPVTSADLEGKNVTRA